MHSLELVCKVWGVVKYFHPLSTLQPEEAGYCDLDAELIRLLDSVKGRGIDETRVILADWIDVLGNFESSKESWDSYLAEYYKGMELKELADMDWICDTDYLGEELSARLVKVYYAVRNKPSKYAYRWGYPYDEKGYEEMGILPVEYRLLGLFRYWNIIEYFFPAKYLTDTPWDEVLRRYIPEFISAEGNAVYVRAVSSLITEICDTHAAQEHFPFLGNYSIRGVAFEIVDGKFYAAQVMGEAAESNTLRPGDEVLRIDGLTYERAKVKYEEVFSFSNKASRDELIKAGLRWTNNNPVSVEFISGEERRVESFPVNPFRDSMDDSPFLGSNKLLMDGRVGYFNPAKYTGVEGLTEIFESFRDTEGVIVDLRYYPGVPVWDIPYRYIDNTDREFAKCIEPSGIFPGLAFVEPVTTGYYAGYQSESTYSGKVVVMVDGGTQSQGEFTTMVFQTLPNVTVIGSQTAGADGNIVMVMLPGGIESWYSGLGVLYPDGTETQRYGVRIDREVRPTVAGLKAERDDLLDEAVNIILNS